MVAKALGLLEAIPHRSLLGGRAQLGTLASRNEVAKKLLDDLRPVLGDLERLHAEFLPEARLPGPCRSNRGREAARTPIENLLGCPDLCVVCCEEAKRALRLIADGIAGREVAWKFLPAAVIAGRIIAAQHEADRDERRWLARPRLRPRFTQNDDGSVNFSVEREGFTPSRTRPVQAKPLQELSQHLITWGALHGYLSKHGIRDIPKPVKELGPAEPKPVWKARKRRSLYKLGDLLGAARRVSAQRERFDELVITPWLRGHAEAPDFRPTWAEDAGTTSRGRMQE